LQLKVLSVARHDSSQDKVVILSEDLLSKVVFIAIFDITGTVNNKYFKLTKVLSSSLTPTQFTFNSIFLTRLTTDFPAVVFGDNSATGCGYFVRYIAND
jgi:hypothetical protein